MEERIFEKLKRLTKEQQFNFVVSCVSRIIDLYKNFDNNEDISLSNSNTPKGEGYNKLVSYFSLVFNELEYQNIDEIKTKIAECEDLIIDTDVFGSSVDIYVAQLVAQSVVYLLEFRLNWNLEKIFYCVENNLEI